MSWARVVLTWLAAQFKGALGPHMLCCCETQTSLSAPLLFLAFFFFWLCLGKGGWVSKCVYSKIHDYALRLLTCGSCLYISIAHSVRFRTLISLSCCHVWCYPYFPAPFFPMHEISCHAIIVCSVLSDQLLADPLISCFYECYSNRL
jgi:hypothetical protein